ncbi:hypothetical protein FKP32DRAFT_94411 [Trametes sanguinea]|nr:hypothetical protein FKP32DRAFT_94411 [Trametes sanguinea]
MLHYHSKTASILSPTRSTLYNAEASRGCGNTPHAAPRAFLADAQHRGGTHRPSRLLLLQHLSQAKFTHLPRRRGPTQLPSDRQLQTSPPRSLSPPPSPIRTVPNHTRRRAASTTGCRPRSIRGIVLARLSSPRLRFWRDARSTRGAASAAGAVARSCDQHAYCMPCASTRAEVYQRLDTVGPPARTCTASAAHQSQFATTGGPSTGTRSPTYAWSLEDAVRIVNGGDASWRSICLPLTHLEPAAGHVSSGTRSWYTESQPVGRAHLCIPGMASRCGMP